VQSQRAMGTSPPVEDQRRTKEGSEVSLAEISQLRFNRLRARIGKMASAKTVVNQDIGKGNVH